MATWRNRLGALGRDVATAVVDNLLKAAEQEQDEGQDRTPGGTDSDSAKNAPVPTEAATQDPKSIFWDPFSVISQLGYKDRPSSISYDTQRAMVYKMPILQAIIQTRVNQVASFSAPQRDRYQLGFRVTTRDPDDKPTSADREWMKQMESLLTRTGVTENPRGRPTFESFLRKFAWDSLVYDQACHVSGTLIELEGGTSVPIEAVQVGDQVVTHRGRARRVTQLKRRDYTGPMVRVRARAAALTMTAKHPLLVAHRTSAVGNAVELSEPEWVEAATVKKTDYLLYPRPRLSQEPVGFPVFADSPRRYPVGDVDGLAARFGLHRQTVYQMLTGTYTKGGDTYGAVRAEAERLGVGYASKQCVEAITEMNAQWGLVLGYYAANGHVSTRSVGFTFGGDGGEPLRDVLAFAERYGLGTTLVDYEERDAVTVLVHSMRLRAFVTEHVGAGASNKRVPRWLLCSRQDVRSAFLRGYLLCDGSLKPNRASFTTTSLDLFTGLRTLLAELGIYAVMARRSFAEYGWREQYVANLSGQEYCSWAAQQGFPVTDEAPRRTVMVTPDYLAVKVSSVEHYDATALPVFNFEVHEDNSYLAEGFVSHNCFEIVPNRKGQPAEWYAIDSKTMRIADTASLQPDEDDLKLTRHVQIYDSVIVNEYTQEELCFGVRNPRSDIRLQGYGTSETEMLMVTITALLHSWQYNQRFFSQGSAAKGILNFKGAVPEHQMKAFRRMWYSSLASVANAWKTPITNADELQWINLQQSNRDMEFSAWFDFQIKIACAIFSMDPGEINFRYGNTGQKAAMAEASNKEKITESKERGLRPLLRFIQSCINQHIMWPINENFRFEFVGLDARTQEEVAELAGKRVKTYITVDELRAEDGLEPLPDGKGEIILDPTWFQSAQQIDGAAQAEAEGGEPDFGGGGDDEGDDDEGVDFESLLAQQKDDEGDEGDKPEKPAKPAEKDEAQKSWVLDVRI